MRSVTPPPDAPSPAIIPALRALATAVAEALDAGDATTAKASAGALVRLLEGLRES